MKQLATSLVLMLLLGAAPAAQADFTVTLVVTDAATGDTLAARCCVVDSQGQDCHAQPDSASCLYHSAGWQNTSFWYTRGVSDVVVPAGPTEIGIAHGFQYHSVLDTVDVQSDTTLVYSLQRLVDMNALRWFSGDCHIHIAHPPFLYDIDPTHLLWATIAEDMNVSHGLDSGHYWTGGPDPCSTADRIVYMCEEYRSGKYGHADLLGVTELVPPFHSEWSPPLADIADATHEQPGALFIPAHPITGAAFFDLESVSGHMLCRELPVLAAMDKVDAYELMSSDRNNLAPIRRVYYHLLNCGFEIPAVSGTDACLNQQRGSPPGCYQTFVHIPVGQTFDYWSWLSNLAQGRTFVTNRPLFTDFEIQGLFPGERASLALDSVELSGRFSVQCEHPLLRADLMVNGEIDQPFFFGPGQTEMDTGFTVTIDRSAWLAIRAIGERPADDWATLGDSLYAHTGPIYFELNGDPILEYADAEFFVDWTTDLIQLTQESGEWNDPADSLHVLGQFYDGLHYFQDLADSTTVGVPGSGPTVLLLGPNQPNPFRTDTVIRYFVPREGLVKMQIYNLIGRSVDTIVDRRQRIGEHTAIWDGRDRHGQPCGSGVYFCRLTVGTSSQSAKIVLLD